MTSFYGTQHCNRSLEHNDDRDPLITSSAEATKSGAGDMIQGENFFIINLETQLKCTCLRQCKELLDD